MNKKKILHFFAPLLLIMLISVAYGAKPKTVTVTVETKKSSPTTQNVFAKTTEPIRGIYLTAWSSGLSKKMDNIIDFVGKTSVNALVIDVKDDTGYMTYPSNVPLAQTIGANSEPRARHLKELVARLKQNNIYTIARIVVFKDPLLAQKRLDLAVKSKTGGLWRDKKGKIWVDPSSEEVWRYNIEIAKEAVAMGFSEIQFDYVRFTSDGKISNCVYPHSKGRAKEDIIHDFLATAKKELNGLGVPLSADIFGLVLTVSDDLNLGQQLEKIASAVDYICPMTYPSHYPVGTFNIKSPNHHPYDMVYNSLKEGVRRLKAINSTAKFRPWLQDFDLGEPPYNRKELMEQIKALSDNGIQEWLFWNPRNKYDLSKY